MVSVQEEKNERELLCGTTAGYVLPFLRYRLILFGLCWLMVYDRFVPRSASKDFAGTLHFTIVSQNVSRTASQRFCRNGFSHEMLRKTSHELLHKDFVGLFRSTFMAPVRRFISTFIIGKRNEPRNEIIFTFDEGYRPRRNMSSIHQHTPRGYSLVSIGLLSLLDK